MGYTCDGLGKHEWRIVTPIVHEMRLVQEGIGYVETSSLDASPVDLSTRAYTIIFLYQHLNPLCKDKILHLLFSYYQILLHPHLSHIGIVIIVTGSILTLHPGIKIYFGMVAIVLTNLYLRGKNRKIVDWYQLLWLIVVELTIGPSIIWAHVWVLHIDLCHQQYNCIVLIAFFDWLTLATIWTWPLWWQPLFVASF